MGNNVANKLFNLEVRYAFCFACVFTRRCFYDTITLATPKSVCISARGTVDSARDSDSRGQRFKSARAGYKSGGRKSVSVKKQALQKGRTTSLLLFIKKCSAIKIIITYYIFILIFTSNLDIKVKLF